MNRKLPFVILAAYLVWFVILAINPYDRVNWFYENLGVVMIVSFFVFTYRKFQFSNMSYIMGSFLIFMHTAGGHYTFERVPFGFVSDLFGFSRNNFDRVSHFSVGFYAFPIAEFLRRKKLTESLPLIALFSIFSILSFAAVYEMIEWGYAASAGTPDAANAFLGSQGDIWDAQKDMLADGLGAVLATGIFIFLDRKAGAQAAAHIQAVNPSGSQTA